MNKLGSVIRFTFRSQTRTKSYKIGTVFFIILITIGIHVPLILQAFNPGGEDKVAVLPSATAIPAALQAFYEQQEDSSMTIILLEDQGSQEANEQLAKQMLFDGKIDGYLIIREDDAGLSSSAELKAKDIDSGVLQDLQMALQLIRTSLVAERLELTGDDLLELNRSFSIEPTIVTEGDEGKSEEEIAVTFVFVIIMLTLLFMSIFGGGTMVATEVSSEKSSRVMEILISSVSPIKQMAGKLIGICLLGLVQLLFFVAVIALNVTANPGGLEMLEALGFDLGKLEPSLFLYFLIFYLIGYFTYGTLSAAIGSMVSRTEELNQAITPVMVLIIIAFFIAFYGTQDPNTMLVKVTSYVPFLAPLIMFVRIGMSDPAIWEIWLSIAIQLVAIWALSWLSAKIYRTGVLMYGKRPSLKELWKAMKAYGI